MAVTKGRQEPNTTMRRLLISDVPAMEQLIRLPELGWEQTTEDLHRAASQHLGVGIFADADQEQKLLSMACLPTFGTKWGWLAYVATHPNYRRRGLASRVIKELLNDESLREIPVIGLYGSRSGAPLYEKLNFVDQGTAHVVRKIKEATTENNSIHKERALREELMRSYQCVLSPARECTSEIQELDRKTYGPGREDLVRELASSDSPGWALIAKETGQQVKTTKKCIGYILSRPMYSSQVDANCYFVGPIVAEEWSQAAKLLQAVLAVVPASSQIAMLVPRLGEDDLHSQQFLSALGFDDSATASPARLMIRSAGTDGQDMPIPWMKACSQHQQQEGVARPFAATGYEFG